MMDLDEDCWVGYQQKGMKEKNGRMVPIVSERLQKFITKRMVKVMVTHLNM